jgi:hypothetical protein
MSQLHPVPTTTSYFLKIRLNIILSPTTWSPQWSLSLWFPHQYLLHTSPFLHGDHKNFIPQKLLKEGWKKKIKRSLNLYLIMKCNSSTFIWLSIYRLRYGTCRVVRRKLLKSYRQQWQRLEKKEEWFIRRLNYSKTKDSQKTGKLMQYVTNDILSISLTFGQ